MTLDLRTGLENIEEDECRRLLRMHNLGRLAVSIRNQPEIFPVNYVVDRDDTIIFRTAEGTKLAAAVLGTAVAFEVDRTDPALETGWSVVARGRAVEVDRLDDLMDLEELRLRPWAGVEGKHRFVRIVPERLTGRRIVKYPGVDDGTAIPHPEFSD